MVDYNPAPSYLNRMIVNTLSGAAYGSIFLSLFCIDLVLGNGIVDMLQKLFCKITCYVKRAVRDEAKIQLTGPEIPISVPVLLVEILMLTFTIALLNRYKQYRGKDRIDELLQESKDALNQTNEFLEKWRLRRVPSKYTYLDDEPQEIKPLKLEVPILHMAIIDTLGSSRSQPERGDAGDAINISDSTLLSMTSLIDEVCHTPPGQEEQLEEKMIPQYDASSRYLYDLMEEDAFCLEDL